MYIVLPEFRWLGKFTFQFTSATFSGSAENDTEITQMKEMVGTREQEVGTMFFNSGRSGRNV